MPAQLFERAADGRWREHDAKTLGDYFQTDHLGRALVTLDANRDGAVDCLITHLYEPVSLLINETADRGQAIGLVFQAVRGHRDAIGAVVSMQLGSKRVTAQLTAGDGYMCTNQRRISIGLGAVDQATEIVVQWPSGLRQTFDFLDAGHDYLLVEGCEDAYSLLRHED